MKISPEAPLRFRIPVAAALLFVVGSVACDQRVPTDPATATAPRSAILDGTAGGNPHFFFLPPIVKNPSFSGVFNPDISPTLEICRNTQQNAAGRCVSLLARFRRVPGPGDALEPIVVSGQQYSLNWSTKEFDVPLNTPFRVVVHAGDIQLGFVDLVRPTTNSYRNFTTNDVINRTTKGTIPLSFRIERGALCSPTAVECFEGQVGPAGGTFTITRADGTKPAGTEFPAGALDQTVNLIIERYLGECLPTDAPQYQGCYRFRTEPHVENFQLPATVGVCLFDYSALSYFDSGQLRLWKWSEVAGEAITELERVTVQYLECPALNPPTIGMRSSSPLLMGAARTGSMLLKPLAALLLPREAHALVPYEGGKLINFSRIGWVRPLSVEITGGNAQTGKTGTALSAPLTARVINRYGSFSQGVPGRAVTFTPSGDGSAAPPATFTDVLGNVSTVWTLATTPGMNTLLVRALTSRPIAPSPYEADATATATGDNSRVVWLPSIALVADYSGASYLTDNAQLRVSVVGGGLITTAPVHRAGDEYEAYWYPTSLNPSAVYRMSIFVNDVDWGSVDLQVSNGALRVVGSNNPVMDLSGLQKVKAAFRLVQ